MLRSLSKCNTVVAALAQRQVTASNRLPVVAGFHSSSKIYNNNDRSNSSSGNRSSNSFSDLLATLRSSDNSNNSSSSASSSSSDNTRTSSLFGSNRGNNSPLSSATSGRSGMSFFGVSTDKANTTSNPIHFDMNHPTEGRSFIVNSPTAVDLTYRRLRTALNQSNIKRELRLKRNYESGHTRMRREKQERNRKLFGAMVRKKIELIKLMKIR
ncbi:hypothetical protein BX616_006326, partial [Lobosporangium transversale]